MVVGVLQYVDVPFVVSICPVVPVALVESRSSPVRDSLVMVEDASVARVAVKVEAVNLVIVEDAEVKSVMLVVARLDVPVAVREAVTILFACRLVVVAVPKRANEDERLVIVPLVAVSVVKKALVAVIRALKNELLEVAFTAFKTLAKKLVEVALVNAALVEKRLLL